MKMLRQRRIRFILLSMGIVLVGSMIGLANRYVIQHEEALPVAAGMVAPAEQEASAVDPEVSQLHKPYEQAVQTLWEQIQKEPDPQEQERLQKQIEQTKAAQEQTRLEWQMEKAMESGNVELARQIENSLEHLEKQATPSPQVRPAPVLSKKTTKDPDEL